MLVFIIALQAPEASRDWQAVSRLACRTLRSVFSQQSFEWRAILVCNQPPLGMVHHRQLTVVEKTFSIPQTRAERMNDKWLKVRVGLVAARQYAPAHFMIVDADDLVSNRLAQLCADSFGHPGWYMDDGFIYRDGSSFIVRRNNFHRVCGTSAILWANPTDLPCSDDADSECLLLEYGHTAIVDKMRSLGRPLSSLPFCGAVYVTGTGENDSGYGYSIWASRRHLLQQILAHRLVTSSIRKEFSLRPLTEHDHQ